MANQIAELKERIDPATDKDNIQEDDDDNEEEEEEDNDNDNDNGGDLKQQPPSKNLNLTPMVVKMDLIVKITEKQYQHHHHQSSFPKFIESH